MKLIRWIATRFSTRRFEGRVREMHLLLQRAHAHLRLEEYDEARPFLLEVIASRDSINDPDVIAYTLSALDATWLLTERYEDGIAFFSEYINRYPTDPEAHSGRAAALWYLGRHQDAIRDYSRALELKPSHILSLSGRGQVFAEVGEHAKAIVDLDSALNALRTASAPDDSWKEWYQQVEAFVHNGRGFALAGLGDHAAALDEFERSISLCPGNAWVYHNRAQFYDRLGDLEKSGEDYRKALMKRNPALSPIKRSLAEARLSALSTRP